MAGLLWNGMPGTRPAAQRSSYLALIGSLFALFRQDPLLRQRGLYGLLIFAAFSVLWSAMVLPLSASPLALNHTQIGLFGLAGVAG
ncbi:MFS transporter, partial [Psychrobacter sp. SIMBA_152]